MDSCRRAGQLAGVGSGLLCHSLGCGQEENRAAREYDASWQAANHTRSMPLLGASGACALYQSPRFPILGPGCCCYCCFPSRPRLIASSPIAPTASSITMASIPSIKFPSNPKAAPVLSFGSGTALFKKPSGDLVAEALKLGFRSVDAAEVYGNSKSNGEGIVKSGIPRDQIYVLSKVNSTIKDGHDAIVATGRKERDDLQVDALDAFLLHHPPRGKGEPSNLEAWKALEVLRDEGVSKCVITSPTPLMTVCCFVLTQIVPGRLV